MLQIYEIFKGEQKKNLVFHVIGNVRNTLLKAVIRSFLSEKATPECDMTSKKEMCHVTLVEIRA